LLNQAGNVFLVIMEVVMKAIIKRIILLITVTGILTLTGCDKVKIGFFDASDENTGSVSISENAEINNEEKDDDKAKEASGGKKDASAKDNSKNNDEGKKDQTLAFDTKKEDSKSSSPTPIQPNPTIDLQIYTVNGATAEIEPVTALIPQDASITAELIVNTVVESLADQSIIVQIDSVTTENDKVIVSFKKDKAPYSDMGSGYEAAILDAIAQSLIDNLKEYKKVIYRVENKPYVSGAFEYGIDEPHLE